MYKRCGAVSWSQIRKDFPSSVSSDLLVPDYGVKNVNSFWASQQTLPEWSFSLCRCEYVLIWSECGLNEHKWGQQRQFFSWNSQSAIKFYLKTFTSIVVWRECARWWSNQRSLLCGTSTYVECDYIALYLAVQKHHLNIASKLWGGRKLLLELKITFC